MPLWDSLHVFNCLIILINYFLVFLEDMFIVGVDILPFLRVVAGDLGDSSSKEDSFLVEDWVGFIKLSWELGLLLAVLLELVAGFLCPELANLNVAVAVFTLLFSFVRSFVETLKVKIK